MSQKSKDTLPQAPEGFNADDLQAQFLALNSNSYNPNDPHFLKLPEGWLSVEEYSAKYNIHVNNVYYHSRRGKLRSFVFIMRKQRRRGVLDVPPVQDEVAPEGWLSQANYVRKYAVDSKLVRSYAALGKIETQSSGRGHKKWIKDVPPPEREKLEIDEGWAPVKQYAAKYGLSANKVRYLIREGRLISKNFGDHSLGPMYVAVCVLDAPPDEHPTRKSDLLETVSPPHELDRRVPSSRKQEKSDEKRKERLRTKYLPLFIEKAPQDRMVFTAQELIDLLGIKATTLYREWKQWGFVGRVAPEEYKHLSTGVNLKGKHIYTRRDIVRFLQGEWERAEQGTPDDIMIAATEGTPALDGVYFNYERNNPFPLDARGFFDWLEEVDLQIENKRLSKWVTYRPWSIQREAIEGALITQESGDFKHKIAIFSAPRGEGKSWCKGTKVLMYDGTIKCVEDVIVGDLLMGPDSTPRKVMALGRGREEMFEVTPWRGESFVCNKSHILALKYRKEIYIRREGKRSIRKNEIIDITMPLSEFLERGPDFRGRCMLYRVPVDWGEKPVLIDPYWLGLWTADGDSRRLAITTMDQEVVDYTRGIAAQYGADTRIRGDKRSKVTTRIFIKGKGAKRLREAMGLYGLWKNKHIPLAYKANSRDIRMQLLAGIIDGDGYRNRNSVEIIFKSKQLAEDVAFLARSLGFHAYIKECTKTIKSIGFKGSYYRIGISGDCSVIPVKIERRKCSPRRQIKNILRTTVKDVRSLGEGDYYGFVLDGDHLFLLDNFTVAHNTVLVSIVTLFFFFNGYSETIILAGNTKDQSTFTHYDLCKSIIQHTPKLRRTPGLEIKEKYIALKTGPKEMFNSMRAVPTSVGLLPGTTRAVFTELHNLQDTKFFYDLWSSLRNVPNAMVLVDTTVARPGHLVHSLWQTFIKGEDPKLYFHHYADKHYNPEMTPEELNHFRQTMPEILFNMYFRNRWEDAAGSLFPVEKIKEMGVCGLDGTPGLPTPELSEAVKQLREFEIKRNNYARGQVDLSVVNREIAAVERRLVPVSSIYKLPATAEDLEKIGKIYNCDFIIGVGLDRAMRQKKHPGRTVMSCVARGVVNDEMSLYFVLDVFIPTDSTLPVLADKFLEWSIKYGWIDKVAIEAYSAEDFYNWASDKTLSAELCYPTFAKQKPVFFCMSTIVDNGQLKCPPVPYYADEEGKLHKGFTNQNDVFREEMEIFNYVPGLTEQTGTFGSPEKHKKSGVQDDSIYSVGWAIYATHGEGLVPTRRGGGSGVISAIVNQDVVGVYK